MGMVWALQAFTVPGSTFGQSAPSTLMVVGNQIVNSSGCTVLLKGVNVDGLESSANGYGPLGGGMAYGGNTLAVAQMAVTGWNCNFIRLPLRQDFWFGCSGSSASGYQSTIASIVNYCSAQGVYILLDLHWSGTYGGLVPTDPTGCNGASGWGTSNAQQVMPDWNAVTFWSAVAATYANNPAVLFDLYNEPHPDSGYGLTGNMPWQVWQLGSQGVTMAGVPSQCPGMQNLLNAVRATGANNVCLVGGLNWAYYLNQVDSYPLTNVGNGIVYSAHIYPVKGPVAGSTWDPWVTSATVNHPVLIGEFGPTNCVSTVSGSYGGTSNNFDSTIIPWMNGGNNRGYVYGGTAWSMTTVSCPNLLISQFTPTTYHGAPVQAWLSTPIVPCVTNTFTPTATPCGYPGNTCTPTDTFTPTNTFTPTPTPYPNNDVAWPNPWDGSQPVSFYHPLSTPADSVHLKVYTSAFRKIYEDDSLEAGKNQPNNWQTAYSLSWNQLGGVANGLYYVVLEEWRGGNMSRKVIKFIILR